MIKGVRMPGLLGASHLPAEPRRARCRGPQPAAWRVIPMAALVAAGLGAAMGTTTAGTTAEDLIGQSGPTRSMLLELYSSEGCSSCPSAEAWLGTLKRSPDLWTRLVPIGFHVDYWDGLGWKDRLARPEFTKRQEAYADRWGGSSVYTPAFVLNGREWRRWGGEAVPTSSVHVGVLALRRASAETFTVVFEPSVKRLMDEALHAHVAVLGVGITSHVERGENRGRTLQHNFVALAYDERPMARQGRVFEATIHLTVGEGPDDVHPERYALACWVTSEQSAIPLQATGGYLPDHP